LCIAHTNVYLVEDEGRVLIVDAGLPSFWKPLRSALAALGRSPADVVGVVLTHAHFDHVGVARRIQREWHVPVLVHPGDEHLAAHPYSYRPERARLLYPLQHPGGLKPLLDMAVAGALVVRGVSDTTALTASTSLPIPAIVLPTPGHTDGHVAIHFPDRDAVITGDALVTLDPYTGGTGAQIVARAATADSPQALHSLDALATTGSTIVLPGHGEPWRDGIASAVSAARHRGAH
jgi:glyoxylase-like metal-dependent hydrolase (beta-lactamase superfamily II)